MKRGNRYRARVRHCLECDEGQAKVEGQCWCACHVGTAKYKRQSWQQRAEELRLRIINGGKA